MKQYIVKNFPFLGKYKRLFFVLRAMLEPTRNTYSQHGEDVLFLETLRGA